MTARKFTRADVVRIAKEELEGRHRWVNLIARRYKSSVMRSSAVDVDFGAVPEMPEVVVADTTKSFMGLEQEWEDLYRNSPLATPLQSWA